MAKKYWEIEEPKLIATEKNEIRIYEDSGKVQVFPRISSGRGIGRGATIDLEGMEIADLDEFQELMNTAINKRREQLAERGEA